MSPIQHGEVFVLPDGAETDLDIGHYDLSYYTAFGQQVRESKRAILEWLIQAKWCGKKIAGFGAPGKGNTLLNYCGIGTDFIDFVVDDSPHKQGLYLPSSRIPILHPAALREQKPDWVIIMPWNWREEIAGKLSYIKEWGGRCVTLLPQVTIV